MGCRNILKSRLGRLLVIFVALLIFSIIVVSLRETPSTPTSMPTSAAPTKAPIESPTEAPTKVPTVTLQHPLSDVVQMFKGDKDKAYDEVLTTFPVGTTCEVIDIKYLDIGLEDPVKYHYLKCDGTTGWINSKYVK